MNNTILEVSNLKVKFKTSFGDVTAVDGISFKLEKGKTLGIVGESGSGKTVTALSIMSLIQNTGFIESGTIKYHETNLLDLNNNEIRKIRGNRISMIFQEPMTSLNPVFTCGNQIDEVLKLHNKHMNSKERKTRVIELLSLVGIPHPHKRVNEYPHQLSGGMRQRVMIAMSLACSPDILIADEPTTALDVTIQAQILDLMKKLQKELGMGLILITHDLGVVAETCDNVAVMYCGEIVEQGTVAQIFQRPQHPYTNGLLASIPRYSSVHDNVKKKLATIDGMVPSLKDLPDGCNFQERCKFASPICKQTKPKLTSVDDGQLVACFNPVRTYDNR